MKPKTAVLAILLVLFLPGALMADDGGTPYGQGKDPKIVIPEATFTFDTVLDGETVVHDYVVKNQGDADLVVEKVRTSCGCTAASYTRVIPPGSEGKINVTFNSGGYGGHTVTKTVTLVTNDPVRRNNVITLTGPVEAFATVSPRFARLSAPVGDPAVETLTITGNPKYPFHVTGTRQVPVNADKFKHKIELVTEKPVPVYRLTVTNLQKQNGTYYGSIYLTTDSPEKKEFPISVQGNIYVPRPKASAPPVRHKPYVSPFQKKQGGEKG